MGSVMSCWWWIVTRVYFHDKLRSVWIDNTTSSLSFPKSMRKPQSGQPIQIHIGFDCLESFHFCVGHETCITWIDIANSDLKQGSYSIDTCIDNILQRFQTSSNRLRNRAENENGHEIAVLHQCFSQQFRFVVAARDVHGDRQHQSKMQSIADYPNLIGYEITNLSGHGNAMHCCHQRVAIGQSADIWIKRENRNTFLYKWNIFKMQKFLAFPPFLIGWKYLWWWRKNPG